MSLNISIGYIPYDIFAKDLFVNDAFPRLIKGNTMNQHQLEDPHSTVEEHECYRDNEKV